MQPHDTGGQQYRAPLGNKKGASTIGKRSKLNRMLLLLRGAASALCCSAAHDPMVSYEKNTNVVEILRIA